MTRTSRPPKGNLLPDIKIVTGTSLMTSLVYQLETPQDRCMLHNSKDQTWPTEKIKDCLTGPAGPLTRNQDLLTGTEDLMENQQDLHTREDQMKKT